MKVVGILVGAQLLAITAFAGDKKVFVCSGQSHKVRVTHSQEAGYLLTLIKRWPLRDRKVLLDQVPVRVHALQSEDALEQTEFTNQERAISFLSVTTVLVVGNDMNDQRSTSAIFKTPDLNLELSCQIARR